MVQDNVEDIGSASTLLQGKLDQHSSTPTITDIIVRNNRFFFSDIFNFYSFSPLPLILFRSKLKSYHLGLLHGKVSCKSMAYGTKLNFVLFYSSCQRLASKPEQRRKSYSTGRSNNQSCKQNA